MGSFGGSSKKASSSASKNTKAAVAALQPKPYSDPYGNFSGGVFTPTQSADATAARVGADSKLSQSLAGLPTSMSGQDLFDNPFYGQLHDYYNREIDTRKAQDNKSLADNLNAQNQGGSSYDAYSHSLLDQNYGKQYADSENQARLGAANTWMQAYQNQLQGINTLGGLQSQQTANMYAPFNAATQYQNAVAPLQGAQANAYNNLSGIQSQLAMNQSNNLFGLGNTLINGYFGASQAVAKALAGGG